MNKMKVNFENGNMQIEATGDLVDNALDCCLIISSLYHSMKEKRPGDAAMFRAMVIKAVNSGDTVWERIPNEGFSLDIPTKK